MALFAVPMAALCAWRLSNTQHKKAPALGEFLQQTPSEKNRTPLHTKQHKKETLFFIGYDQIFFWFPNP
jgi:hypothetical protein